MLEACTGQVVARPVALATLVVLLLGGMASVMCLTARRCCQMVAVAVWKQQAKLSRGTLVVISIVFVLQISELMAVLSRHYYYRYH